MTVYDVHTTEVEKGCARAKTFKRFTGFLYVKEIIENMRKWVILACIMVAVAIVVGYSMWVYMNHLDYLSKTKHETDRWAVILDSRGDIITVETINDQIWNTLGGLHQNQTVMWIGGIIEEYDNKWGFRFNPETIIVAQITIEGAQSNIQGISGDLNYWMNIWAKEVYVLARVVEMHE